MKITEMIKALNKPRAIIAQEANISIQQLNNQVSKGVEVVELKDGRFVTIRKDATYFKAP